MVRFIAAAACVGSFLGAAVQAAPVTWQTEDEVIVTAPVYLGGASTSFHGGFTYDAATGAISDWAFFMGARSAGGGSAILFTEMASTHLTSGLTRRSFDFEPVQPDSCTTSNVGCLWERVAISAQAAIDFGAGPVQAYVAFSDSSNSYDGATTLSVVPATVPLPASGAALLAGIAAFGLMRRRA